MSARVPVLSEMAPTSTSEARAKNVFIRLPTTVYETFSPYMEMHDDFLASKERMGGSSPHSFPFRHRQRATLSIHSSLGFSLRSTPHLFSLSHHKVFVRFIHAVSFLHLSLHLYVHSFLNHSFIRPFIRIRSSYVTSFILPRASEHAPSCRHHDHQGRALR